MPVKTECYMLNEPEFKQDWRLVVLLFLPVIWILHLITSPCRHTALQHPCEHKDCSSPLIKIWQSGVLHIPYCVSLLKRNSYSYLITIATRGKYWCRHFWPNLLWHLLNLVFDSSLWLKFRFFGDAFIVKDSHWMAQLLTHTTLIPKILCAVSLELKDKTF